VIRTSLLDHYVLGRKLGQGQFGIAYLCMDLFMGVDYACRSTVNIGSPLHT
jgi:calcium-dependent protein kinase